MDELLKLLVTALIAEKGMSRQDAEAEATEQLEKLKGEQDTLKAENEKLKTENAALKRADSAEARLEWFRAREKYAQAARGVGIDEERIVKLDNADLVKAIVLAAKPEARADASTDYYEGVFDSLAPVETHKPKRGDSEPNKTFRLIPGKGNEGRQDGEDDLPCPEEEWLNKRRDSVL